MSDPITDYRLSNETFGGKTHLMCQFGGAAKPPQFGKTKAATIVSLSDAGVEAEVIKTAAVGFGIYKLKGVDAKAIVEGARALGDAA